ncbi:hypothetical protein CR513_32362, partial [Mucuna pruriens]
MPQQEKPIPLPFPTYSLSTRKPELLRMFQKVEINIPLLDAMKQIPKYVKFLKELCVHKRKKMKGGVELGGIMSTLTRNEYFTAEAQQALPKKCRGPKIFSIPCTIGDYTFTNAMLDLGASINVMPTSKLPRGQPKEAEVEKVEVDSARKRSVKAGLIVHT